MMRSRWLLLWFVLAGCRTELRTAVEDCDMRAGALLGRREVRSIAPIRLAWLSPSPFLVGDAGRHLREIEACVQAGYVREEDWQGILEQTRGALTALHLRASAYPADASARATSPGEYAGVVGWTEPEVGWPELVLWVEERIHRRTETRATSELPNEPFAWTSLRTDARVGRLIRLVNERIPDSFLQAKRLHEDLRAELAAWASAPPARRAAGPGILMEDRLGEVASHVHRICQVLSPQAASRRGQGPECPPVPNLSDEGTTRDVRTVDAGLLASDSGASADARPRVDGPAAIVFEPRAIGRELGEMLREYVRSAMKLLSPQTLVRWPTVVDDRRPEDLQDAQREAVPLGSLELELEPSDVCRLFASRDATRNWLALIRHRWRWPYPPWAEGPFWQAGVAEEGRGLARAHRSPSSGRDAARQAARAIVASNSALASRYSGPPAKEARVAPAPRIDEARLLVCLVNGAALTTDAGGELACDPFLGPYNTNLRQCVEEDAPAAWNLLGLRHGGPEPAAIEASARGLLAGDGDAMEGESPVGMLMSQILLCHSECVASREIPGRSKPTLAPPLPEKPAAKAGEEKTPPPVEARLEKAIPIQRAFPDYLATDIKALAEVCRLTAVERVLPDEMPTRAAELGDAFRRIDQGLRRLCATEMPAWPCSPQSIAAAARTGDLGSSAWYRYCGLLRHGAAFYLRAAQPGDWDPWPTRWREVPLLVQLHEFLPTSMSAAHIHALGQGWTHALGACESAWEPEPFDAKLGCY